MLAPTRRPLSYDADIHHRSDPDRHRDTPIGWRRLSRQQRRMQRRRQQGRLRLLFDRRDPIFAPDNARECEHDDHTPGIIVFRADRPTRVAVRSNDLVSHGSDAELERCVASR
jgi:hypothetical protein